MSSVLILTAYNGFFATKFIGSKQRHTQTTIDATRLRALFEARGIPARSCSFAEVDFSADYTDVFVIYASSEDRGGFYKGYIEDVLLALRLRGATLIPSFPWFRAHADKAFQEMLRASFQSPALRRPAAVAIGHVSELSLVEKKLSFPAVVKNSAGSGSRGVLRVDSLAELRAILPRIMKHHYHDAWDGFFRRLGRRVKQALRLSTTRSDAPTNRVIIQEMVPSLRGDYKVLCFRGRFFVLERKNRAGDFRASGSGLFRFPEDTAEIADVLAFALLCAEEIGMPLLSLDIARGEEGCFLLEFQALCFGPYTLQYAPCCYEKKEGAWQALPGRFDLEEEYVRAVSSYLTDA